MVPDGPTGDALTPEQRKIVDYLNSATNPKTAIQVADGLKRGFEATKKLLQRMAAGGVICGNKGQYSLAPRISQQWCPSVSRCP